jgi:hypothetical protein
MAFTKQALAQMRAQEAGATGNKYPLTNTIAFHLSPFKITCALSQRIWWVACAGVLKSRIDAA